MPHPWPLSSPETSFTGGLLRTLPGLFIGHTKSSRSYYIVSADKPASSSRHCAYGERGPVLVNEARKAELQIRKTS